MSGIEADVAGPPHGPVVVLVHGTMDRAAGLRKLSRRLARDHRVVSYDRRGYGRSAPHPGPFAMSAQVDDLVGVLDGRPAVVFGHSYGGNVALATAARHPDLVLGVAVYEVPLTWLRWWPGATAGADALGAGHGAPADAAERFMRRLIGDDRWGRLPDATRAARRREGAALVGELTDLRANAPWNGADIRAPVVAMHGSAGAPHHRRSGDHIARAVPGAEVVEIAGAGHVGPATHPDAVAAVVAGLVSRVAR